MTVLNSEVKSLETENTVSLESEEYLYFLSELQVPKCSNYTTSCCIPKSRMRPKK